MNTSNNHSYQSPENVTKILVAEDNLMNQKIIQVLLRKEGYEVEVVSNGKEAILALEQSSFDGLVLDYQMPEMDGYQVLQIIHNHANQNIRQIPVIFLTAELNQETLRQIKQHGVFQMLSKPIDPKKLLETIAQLKKATEQSPNQNHLTSGYLYNITDGNLEIMIELIDIFMEEAPLALQKMKASFNTNDFPALLKTIHKVRSNYKYVGMLEGEKLLADLEQDVEHNRNPQTYLNRIQDIESLTLTFLQFLTHEKQLLQRK